MKKERKKMPFIEAGSMADIAFLLLIFFLVTTTIQTQAGLNTKLPVFVENPKDTPIFEDNLLRIKVNGGNQLQVGKLPTAIVSLPQQITDFVLRKAQSPQQAVISIECNESTSYDRYIAVLDAVKICYQKIWNKEASQRYGRLYNALSKLQQETILQDYPLVISEPKLFKKNN